MSIIDPMSPIYLGRILLSILLGGIVGFEREVTKKPAGVRTHMLVCMGSCLFTISSFYLIPSPEHALTTADMTRIAAAIVAGIGFIGAGSIIARRERVKGLTTAASLWVVAAVGLMVGIGEYVISSIAAVLAFIILELGRLE